MRRKDYSLNDLKRNAELREERVTRIDNSEEGVTYIGIARSGADTAKPVWKIKRITDNEGETIIEWSSTDSSYSSVWDDRLTLSYS